MTVAILVLVAVVLIGLVVLATVSIKIVREYQRVVLFRLGRANSARGPGLIIINPITDRISWVDLRERYLEIPHQTAITQDNAAIAIDFIIFYKVLDPLTSVLAVQDFKGAATNIASTTLRSVVGDMTLDDVLSKRDEMNGVLRLKLDDVTERWGVKVTNVEVTRDQAAPCRPRGYDPPDGGRADTTSRCDRGRWAKASLDHRGRRPEAIIHPASRGRTPKRRTSRTGLRSSAPPDPRSRRRLGLDDDDIAVLGNSEANW